MAVRIIVVACLLCWSVTSRAEDPVASESTSDLARVRLLDEVPNYAEILRTQWSRGVPAWDEDGAPGHYGLLLDTGPERSITLQESIALALQNNTGLRVKRLSPISAAAGVRSARAVFDPAFFGEVSKNRSVEPVGTISVLTAGGSPTMFNQQALWTAGLRKTLLSGGSLSAEWTNQRLSYDRSFINLVVPSYETTLGLSLTQPLLRDFGWRFALLQVEVAQTVEEQSYYQYRADVATLVAEVERAYWVFVLAIENVRVEEQGLELARELLRQNEGRFKVGALPRTAVLESEAEVARREANLVRARNLRRIARDNLRALINYRQPDGNALLMIEPADSPTVVHYDMDIERSLGTGFEQRPELIAARLEVDSKKLLRKAAQNQLLPRLDLVGSIGLNGLGGRCDDEEKCFPPETQPAEGSIEFLPPKANPQILGGYDRSLELLTDGRFYQYAFGATIEVPIANAEAKAAYAQAKVDTERARLTLREVEEQVTLEITQALGNLESNLKRIEATRIARELAEENVRNQRARYDVGLATTKDLIDFQDRLTQARQAEIVVLTAYNTDLAALRRAEGTILEARDIRVERKEPEASPWWARF